MSGFTESSAGGSFRSLAGSRRAVSGGGAEADTSDQCELFPPAEETADPRHAAEDCGPHTCPGHGNTSANLADLTSGTGRTLHGTTTSLCEQVP